MKRVFVLGAAALAFSFGSLVVAADDASAAERKKGEKGERGSPFAKLLKDGDGKITKEAFEKFIAEKAKGKGREGKAGELAGKFFTKLDKNADGAIDADELKGAKGDFKGKGKGLRGKKKAQD